jgi:flagellar hook-length control protein FliK
MKTMMQIATIQVAPQPPSTDTTLTKESSNLFTPHLEKAVTEATQTNSGTTSQTLTPASSQSFIDSPPLEAAGSLFDAPISNDTAQGAVTDQTGENIFSSVKLANDEKELSLLSAKQVITLPPPEQNVILHHPKIDVSVEVAEQELNTPFTGKKITIQPPEQNINVQAPGRHVSLNALSKEPPILTTGKELSLLSGETNGKAPLSQAVVPPLNIQKTDFSSLSLPSTNTLDQPLKVDFTGVQPHTTNPQIPAIGQNQTLLQQLQQIINNGNETGTVSIQAADSNYSFQYRGVAGAKLGEIASSQIQEPGKFSENPGPKIPALRQDMLGQYFDAKLSTREQRDSASNTQTSDQQNSANNQQASASPQPNSSVLPEQPGSFQSISALMQDIQTNQSQSSIKPVILPSGTVVDENNVIQQVAERFQINNRANDIKLNLKLHPEELGELKIDLTLKEGSIKGNVVAQSQQIQEIIEKNMAKLRSILEDQGFTVEEIVVTSESDTVPDFDLFEQHLSQQSDFTPPSAEIPQEIDFDVALEDAVVQSAGSSTGVNIKA